MNVELAIPGVAAWAWAGGLFEGEGWTSPVNHGEFGVYMSIGLASTDAETVDRFAAIVGCGTRRGPYDQGPGRKAKWLWSCQCWADCEALVARLWLYLGSRRRDRIVELVEQCESAGLGPRRKPWVSRPWEPEEAHKWDSEYRRMVREQRETGEIA